MVSRLTSVFLSVVLVLASSSVALGDSTLRGDVNGDGVVTVADANEVYSIILGTSHTTGIAAIDRVLDDMVAVEGGTFSMGATPEQADEANSDEKPERSITLSSFRISRFEVTQELWTAVMGSNPSATQADSLPVTNVSHSDCAVFLAKLNELTGLAFRLPTEAEWEYAARGGQLSQGYKYSGGNDADLVAWYGTNSGAPHKVGELAPNELGLYDMSGNVNEWCSDWYGSYDASTLLDPAGPDTGSSKVFRGGAYNFVVASCRVALRLAIYPDYKTNNIGLRLAL